MHKLFTCLYGSTLYGTNSSTSDRDVKHIVLPALKDVLIGKQIKNKVKKTNGAQEKNKAEDVDEEFIPIQVFARDFMEGQTYALELAYAVDYTKAEQEVFHESFKQFCHELRERFLTKHIRAMVGYAMNQAVIYSNKGERLNAVTALFEVLLNIGLEHVNIKHDESANMQDHWAQVIKAVSDLEVKYPKYVKIETYAINPDGDMRPCIKMLEKIIPYNVTFDVALATINATKKKYGKRAESARADQIDWKATSHALRIINEGIDLLSAKPLVYPYPIEIANYYKAIKEGKVNYDNVMAEINANMEKLSELQLVSSLPDLSHELGVEMDNWLFGWLIKFYEDFEPDIICYSAMT